jgi:hypothetical protein
MDQVLKSLGPLKIPAEVLLLFDVWAEVLWGTARVSVPAAHKRKVFFFMNLKVKLPIWLSAPRGKG